MVVWVWVLVSYSGELRIFVWMNGVFIVLWGFSIGFKGTDGFGTESTDNILYFFYDQSYILILLIRHYGTLDFLDFIWEGHEVREILQFDFVGRDGFDESTDEPMKCTALNEFLLFVLRVIIDGVGINFRESLEIVEYLFELIKEMGGRLELEEVVSDGIEWREYNFEGFDDLGQVFIELRFVNMRWVKWLNLEHAIKNPPELCIFTFKENNVKKVKVRKVIRIKHIDSCGYGDRINTHLLTDWFIESFYWFHSNIISQVDQLNCHYLIIFLTILFGIYFYGFLFLIHHF